MRKSLFAGLCTFLLIAPSFANYWSPGLTPVNAVTETSNLVEWLSTVTAGATGLGKTVSDIFSKPSSAIYGFFSTINDWIGEFVLLFRIIFWVLTLVGVQVLAVAFWVIVVKTIVKGYMIFKLFTQPEETIRAIDKNFKHRKATSMDKAQAILTIIKPVKN